MEISARNQLKGTVKTVTADGLMAEVIIDIGGQEIASTITRASAERLGLRSGDTVVAIIKASEVLVAK
jgi:molybdopterin-binding protein